MSHPHVLLISGSTSRNSATRDLLKEIAGRLETAGSPPINGGLPALY